MDCDTAAAREDTETGSLQTAQVARDALSLHVTTSRCRANRMEWR